MLRIPLSLFKTACPYHRDQVLRLWPNGVPLTPDAVRLAASHELDFRWLARETLTRDAWGQFDAIVGKAGAAYQRMTEPFTCWSSAPDPQAALEVFKDVSAAATQAYWLALGHTLLRLLLLSPENRLPDVVEEVSDAADSPVSV